MTYASVAELREYLKQVASESEPVLLAVLERAHAIINDYLGFEFQGYTLGAKDVRSTGGQYLLVPVYEAGSITEVALVTGRGTSAETVTPVTGWVEEEDGTLYLDYGWLDGWYRVTANFGYGDVPQSVVEVELEIAVNVWQSREAGSFAAVLGAEGQGTVSYSRALTWAQRSVLDAVRARYLGGVHA